MMILQSLRKVWDLSLFSYFMINIVLNMCVVFYLTLVLWISIHTLPCSSPRK
ncbi:hypothetical protein HanIR_Chr07g0315841 [Helianthus annuus]|uniref:Uncharacterized protein n=1 Tax=Helianthus annuus TaxID=4232 RepID=A0A251UA27_HELAN|nr:hypothetical protein HanIR_Chr07g0315841 [Helianthus annuus]